MTLSPTSLGRALEGSPLRKPLGGCLFAAGMMLLFSIALLGHILLWAFNSFPALQVAVTGMALATLVSLPTLALLWYLDRRERESLWVLMGMLLWGAALSTGLSSIFNSLFSLTALLPLIALGVVDTPGGQFVGELLSVAVGAPLVEETAKGLGVLLVFWLLRAEFDNVRDGIIYGALIGLGFNIAEYGLYIMLAFLETETAPYAGLLAIRMPFWGFNHHLVWTALVGAGIGLARQTHRGWLRLAAPLGGYVLALLGHALNNSVGIVLLGVLLSLFGYRDGVETVGNVLAAWSGAVIGNIVLQFIPYVILFVLLIRGGRWERRIIRDYLAGEVATGAVTPEEYGLIQHDRLLGTRRLAGSPRNGKAIVNAQNELAFRKWHLAREGHDPDSDPLVRAWREDIARLRGSGQA